VVGQFRETRWQKVHVPVPEEVFGSLRSSERPLTIVSDFLRAACRMSRRRLAAAAALRPWWLRRELDRGHRRACVSRARRGPGPPRLRPHEALEPGRASAPGTAEFLVRLLDELGWEEATVHGDSMGGVLAARLASLASGRVSRFVLTARGSRPPHRRCTHLSLHLGPVRSLRPAGSRPPPSLNLSSSTSTWTGKPDLYHAVQATFLPRLELSTIARPPACGHHRWRTDVTPPQGRGCVSTVNSTRSLDTSVVSHAAWSGLIAWARTSRCAATLRGLHPGSRTDPSASCGGRPRSRS
jgi:pimeloyl-ACP methyl ester carboxylesterase